MKIHKEMRCNQLDRMRMLLQEKTRAAAAPRKPKKGAVSSPLKVDDIFSDRERRKDLRSDQI